MFICCECKKKMREKDRVFRDHEWCRSCYDIESTRSIAQDATHGLMRSRPPKYMLTREQYATFGY